MGAGVTVCGPGIALVAGVLFGVAVAAGFMRARKAARLDPLVGRREE